MTYRHGSTATVVSTWRLCVHSFWIVFFECKKKTYLKSRKITSFCFHILRWFHWLMNFCYTGRSLNDVLQSFTNIYLVATVNMVKFKLNNKRHLILSCCLPSFFEVAQLENFFLKNLFKFNDSCLNLWSSVYLN